MEFIRKIIKTKTFEHSIVTLVGTGVNGVLGVLFFILLARELGPSEFGLVSVSIVFLTLISDIADLGINTGLINFVSKHVHSDSEKVKQFLKLGLESKIVLWLLVLIFGWFLTPFIADNIFLKSELIFPLRLSLIGVGGAMLFSFTTNSLQALQLYRVWSMLNIGANTLRLLVTIVLISFLALTPDNSLITYIAVPFFGFLVGMFFLPRGFLNVKGESSVAKEFFHFNKWIALSILISAFASRVDTFFLTRLTSFSDVGIYSAASQLTSFLPQITYALAAVAAPKLGGFISPLQAFEYLKKLQLYTLGIAALSLAAVPLAIFVIPVFYGKSFTESIPVFIILFFSQLIFLLSLPSHQSIFYYFSRPKVFTIVSFFHLLIISVLCYILILKFGLLGAAWGVLIGSLFNFVIPGIYVLKRFKKIKI